MTVQMTKMPLHVVVIGAGIMGCDIAAIFLEAGCQVDCLSRDSGKHEQRARRIETAVKQMSGTFRPELLRQVDSYDGVGWGTPDLVIETIPENLDLKREVFTELDRRTGEGVPVASNASGLPISKITGDLGLRHRALGLHFFLPAHLVPLVEVVRSVETDPAIADRVYQMMRTVGRIPVRVNKDTPGFLANRIQHALMREVFAVLDEGLASPEDVDAAVRFSFGMRYVAAGPLMQKEFAGLDTQLAAARSIYPVLSQSSVPSRTLTDIVERGRLGTKTLEGFWPWTPETVKAAKDDYEQALMAALKLVRRPNRTPQGSATIPGAQNER